MSFSRGNVFLAGVGGQGILLASEIMGEAFLRGGYDVKKSEVHGMAQRGGAVTTHLRFGPAVHAPLIEPGTADLLIAFEKMEALRFLHFLKPGGTVLVNTQEILPAPVSSGQERYPDRIEERLREAAPSLYLLDALGAALALHEVRAVNLVMTGAASHFLPLPEERYLEALAARLPARFVDVNAQAFRAGRALVVRSDADRRGGCGDRESGVPAHGGDR
jgi:indolepyruvate ferredoxin oxidoreductase, beta subunit